jgi:hypothetical protein
MRKQEALGKSSNQSLQDRILLHYTGILDDERIPALIDRLTNDDWSTIIQKATTHGVAPLIYNRLYKECCLPDDIAQRLLQVYLYCSLNNTLQHHELSMMLTKFKTEGIKVIVLKGLAVVGLLYENIAFRPMVDIDLLVKSEDVPRIDKMLSELEWQNLSQRLTGDIHYKKNMVLIDLHSVIYDLPKLDPWISESFVKLNGLDIPTLCLNDLFLFLCVHLDKHIHIGFSELIRLCDIIKLLRKYKNEIDWDYIAKTAIENGVECSVHRVLNLFRDLPDTHVPSSIFSHLKNDGFYISIYDTLLIPERSILPIKHTSLEIAIKSKMLPTSRKFSTILQLICPNRKYMVYRYTSNRPKLFYLYYLKRIALGIKIALRLLLQKR